MGRKAGTSRETNSSDWNSKAATTSYVIIHTTTLIIYVSALYFAFTKLRVPPAFTKFNKSTFNPGQFKFLTIWNLIIQAVFFLICILNDLVGSNKINPKKRPFVRALKDYVHATFAFPVAMFIGITFWGLMFVDRELVLPKALDAYFPWWLNHIMHTMIVVSTLLEMLVAPRQYPKRSQGLTGLLLFMFSYLIWIHVIYAKSAIWVYPVLDVLSLPLRILFFLVLLALSAVLYVVGEGIDHVIWGTAKKSTGKPSKKRKSK